MPVLGSSKMYVMPVRLLPIYRTSLSLCASPPESVDDSRSIERYGSPMSIMRCKDAVSVAVIDAARGSVIERRTLISSVNSMAHISSMLYPATLHASARALSRRPRQTGQGASDTRLRNRRADASFIVEVSRFMSIRWR